MPTSRGSWTRRHPGLLVGQAIGRVGNYFNQELFGGPTNLPWGVRIDVPHRPDGFAQYAAFQPTFLYELIWNLGLAGALVWVGHHRRIRAPGLFALYVAGYSFGRVWEELLRVDPAHHIFGLRLNFYVALVLCLAGLAWFAQIQWRLLTRGGWRGAALLLAGGALAISGCSAGKPAAADATTAGVAAASGQRSPPLLLAHGANTYPIRIESRWRLRMRGDRAAHTVGRRDARSAS